MADAGVEAEVVVRIQEDISPSASSKRLNDTQPYAAETPQIIVRAEEVLLVVLVLMIWVAAIALFINRWGKIRMLEPYQPKFQQAHRPSCPIAVDTAVNTGCSISDLRRQRMSFSKFNVNGIGDTNIYSSLSSPRPPQRPRQNSVFAAGSTMTIMNPPRRVKSAMDIQTLLLGESSPGGHSLGGFNSLLPIPIGFSGSREFQQDRRPSITIERPAVSPCTSRHRPSICHDTIMCHLPSSSSSSSTGYARRRPSCLIERPPYRTIRHKFISIDQPSWGDRRTSITIERSPTASVSRRRPSISLEKSSNSNANSVSSDKHPSFTVEMVEPTTSSSIDEDQPMIQLDDHSDIVPYFNKTSVSFEKTSTSFDEPSTSYDRRPSFNLERPSLFPAPVQRLSISLDQAPSKWQGNPTFIIERSTPSPQPPSSPTFETELQPLVPKETESIRVTNV